MIKSKEKDLKSIDKNLIDNINFLLSSVTEKSDNEYKTLLISKDNEISKLNDIILSKENEIKRLNKIIEDMKSGSITQEMEENFKKEKAKLLEKINNLELKIYNIKEEKNKLNTNNKNNNNANENNKENNNKDNKEKNDEQNEENNLEEKENENKKLDYEELLKRKEEIEIQNQKLIEEIKILKNKNIEDKDNNINVIDNNSNNNEEMQNQIKDLKKIIEDYKNGKFSPEMRKKSEDYSIKNEKSSDFEELKKKYEKINLQNKNYESKIKYLNDNISKNSKNKKDLENIVLKQENKIIELNSLIKKKDGQLFSKETSITKNEAYSLQLMNIIKEQKLQIKNIKKQKSDEESSLIAELKRKISYLENTIELRDNTITNMKKTHKNLQDKYIKLCFNIKKKEQDNLLNQAKQLKKQKIERDAAKGLNKYISKTDTNNANKNNSPQYTEESNGLSEIEYPNLKTNSNINNDNLDKEEKEMINKEKNDIVLPAITTNNSVKIEENINSGNRLDEINNMMKKVIEEN